MPINLWVCVSTDYQIPPKWLIFVPSYCPQPHYLLGPASAAWTSPLSIRQKGKTNDRHKSHISGGPWWCGHTGQMMPQWLHLRERPVQNGVSGSQDSILPAKAEDEKGNAEESGHSMPHHGTGMFWTEVETKPEGSSQGKQLAGQKIHLCGREREEVLKLFNNSPDFDQSQQNSRFFCMGLYRAVTVWWSRTTVLH